MSKAANDKHGGKEKERSELGIALSSPRRFEAQEQTGDWIKDGVRTGIKDGGWGRRREGRDLTLGIQRSCELPPQQHCHVTHACVHVCSSSDLEHARS